MDKWLFTHPREARELDHAQSVRLALDPGIGILLVTEDLVPN